MIDGLGIDNILVAVGNLDEGRVFYGEKLGLPVKFAAEQIGLVCFALGREEPGLLVRQESATRLDRSSGSPRVWLEVADARAVADDLAQASIVPLDPPFEIATGWAVEVSDPWGNVIGFTDYSAAPERGRIPQKRIPWALKFRLLATPMRQPDVSHR